ncbi:unnamed protein product [Rotaria sp. Silwood2]|nr:unnamed protein product [Rotaria sp. Silwood2]CAF2812488.1 unnamed protein product [Rotaria sp. Silwood2]CAF2919086.1 unnamed protein product [Rotaria sp. Silwood2]CAF2970966.1 unnamed protein product [Rotaria sp. Silwood2]CAF4264543.1 unnamed protein product [Rotaria sp. Silwood2]
MMYGRLPVLPFDYQDTNVAISYDSEHATKHKQYKQRYDINRSDPTYKIGDLVLVKTININYKFYCRYKGPFRIIRKLKSNTLIIQHLKKPTLYRHVTTDVSCPIFERIY